jgi:hypothetical protein
MAPSLSYPLQLLHHWYFPELVVVIDTQRLPILSEHHEIGQGIVEGFGNLRYLGVTFCLRSPKVSVE